MQSLAELLMVKVSHFLEFECDPVGLDGLDSDDVLIDIDRQYESIWTKMVDLMTVKGLKIPSCLRQNLRARWSNYLVKGFSIPTVLSSLVKYSDDFARRVTELCSLFGVVLSEEDIEFEREKYLFISLCRSPIPFLKYSTNQAFNRFWKVEMPEGVVGVNQFGFDLWPRRLRVRLSLLSTVNNKRRMLSQILMNTLFQGFKKGLLPVEPELIQAALDKHRKCLQKDPRVPSELFPKIKEKAVQLLKGWRVLDNENYHETSNQSSHATAQVPFWAGGNIGFCRDLMYARPGACRLNGAYFSGWSDLCDSELIGYVQEKSRWSEPKPVYSKGYVTTSDVARCFNFSTVEHRTEDSDHFETCLEAVPACILEPMKVRMITKPSVGLHVRLHKIQKSLWKHLYGHWTGFFRLIGEPLRRDHLWSFFKDYLPSSKMVSGDYSAATDNLKAEVTEAILLAMYDPIADVRESDFWLLRDSLLKLDILQEKTMLPNFDFFECFKDFGYDLKNFRQKNGQLMGNVVSFVILCIANLIAYWLSRERACGHELSLKCLKEKYPVLVNGDDILFRVDSPAEYQAWATQIGDFGFEPSVGKNFVSGDFLQINSELWRIDTLYESERQFGEILPKGIRVREVVKIPYVNFGLLTNRSKNDCSKDLTVAGIGVSGSKGLIEEDSLLGRLKVMPVIREKLLNSLPSKLLERTESLFWSHARPMLRHFGLEGLRDLWFSKEYQRYHEGFFKNVREPYADEREVFGDLSLKMDRGEMLFEISRVRLFLKWKKENPHWGLDLESLYDLREEKVEWVSA